MYISVCVCLYVMYISSKEHIITGLFSKRHGNVGSLLLRRLVILLRVVTEKGVGVSL